MAIKEHSKIEGFEVTHTVYVGRDYLLELAHKYRHFSDDHEGMRLDAVNMARTLQVEMCLQPQDARAIVARFAETEQLLTLEG